MTDRVSAELERKSAARPKGPTVWGDMDQQELDAAYDQSKYAANQAQIQERRLVNSARARALSTSRRPCTWAWLAAYLLWS